MKKYQRFQNVNKDNIVLFICSTKGSYKYTQISMKESRGKRYNEESVCMCVCSVLYKAIKQ